MEWQLLLSIAGKNLLKIKSDIWANVKISDITFLRKGGRAAE